MSDVVSDAMNEAKTHIGAAAILGGFNAIRDQVPAIDYLLAEVAEYNERAADEEKARLLKMNAAVSSASPSLENLGLVVHNCSRGMQSLSEAVSQVGAFPDWGDGQKPIARYKIQRKRQAKKRRKGMRR